MARRKAKSARPSPHPQSPPVPQSQLTAALQVLRAGTATQALAQLEKIPEASLSSAEGSTLQNARGVALALQGEGTPALYFFQEAVSLDPHNLQARMNLLLLQADGWQSAQPATPFAAGSAATAANRDGIRVAVLSFLFNWPSTGGGIVHTVELCDFLQRAGYVVQHIYAHIPDRDIGIVKSAVPFPSQALTFGPDQWNAQHMQERFRQATDAFGPDYVMITDSWNMKPLLAEAVSHYPYLLRLQALECLCPLNNIRLLPAPGGGFQQCPLNQLATPEDCRQCIATRGQRSGSLHREERDLAGVGTPAYIARLQKVFRQAHAVLVVNPLTEAMVAPFAACVRTVTAGMDPARFPDPWPEDPAPPWDRPIKQILFAGLIDEPIKGFTVLHQACQELWKVRQDFELLVTADPPGRIDVCTRSVGWQTQASLPRLMRSVDLVAVPAICQEALGRTAVEAMAAGRPVVASRLGGLPFTIPDGATGLLAEPGDVGDWVGMLQRLLEDALLLQRLGEAGRRRFVEHYSWPEIIERHYRPLLSQKRQRATTGVPA